MRCVSSSIANMSRDFLFVEDPLISSMAISSSPIWVENYGNCEPTSSIENMVRLFGGVEWNVWELWEFTEEGVWVFDIK